MGEKSEIEVIKESLATVNDYKSKAIANKGIVNELGVQWRQKRLNKVVSPEFISEVRETLRLLAKLPVVSNHWIDSLHTTLTNRLNKLEEESQ